MQFSDCRVSVIPNFIHKVKLITVDLTPAQLLFQTPVTYTRDLIFFMYARTYQVECLTIWFNFMFFHIFDKAAVGIPRKGNKNFISNMQIINTAKLPQ